MHAAWRLHAAREQLVAGATCLLTRLPAVPRRPRRHPQRSVISKMLSKEQVETAVNPVHALEDDDDPFLVRAQRLVGANFIVFCMLQGQLPA